MRTGLRSAGRSSTGHTRDWPERIVSRHRNGTRGRSPAPAEARRERLTVFDSTGFALEDHVAFDVLLELAEEAGIGDRVQLEHLPQDALDPYSFQ
ncbi:hypothetical protein ACFV4E_26520 [Streptomyces hygroscopicus]|uniref:hypothetical protein n=1 Tax=Streptomyces TaxID=1883 RepID=UPI0027D7DA4F|nr:hypothetical protein [Streptomyces demainii]